VRREKYYRTLFVVAAIWNWIVTAAFGLTLESSYRDYGFEFPPSPMWIIMFLGFACIFGLGYLYVGLNPVRNRNIAILGVLGKVYMFGVFLIFGLVGDTPIGFAVASILDLVFAGLFVEFLVTSRVVGN
jgi:hypothetical protein